MTIDAIIEHVAPVFGVQPDDIRSKRKPRHISDARNAFYLIARVNGYRWKEVGGAVNKTHSAAYYGSWACNRLMEVDRVVRDKVRTVISKLKENS